MPEIHHLKRLILCRVKQFRYCDLDFSDPATGKPLDRICFSGPNGSGKSTLLSILHSALTTKPLSPDMPETSEEGLVLVQFSLGEQNLYLARTGPSPGGNSETGKWFSEDMENAPAWVTLSENPPNFTDFCREFADFEVHPDDLSLAPGRVTLFLGPDEALLNSISLESLSGLMRSHQQARRDEFHTFLLREENQELPVSAARVSFAEQFPDALAAVRDLWEPVLHRIQLNPGFDGETSLSSAQTGEEVAFSELSTGLQRFLLQSFLTGTCLPIHEPEARGFLFLDSVEESLAGDLPRALLAFALARFTTRPGQAFVATRTPVADEFFAPSETFSLEFTDSGGVAATRNLNSSGEEQGHEEFESQSSMEPETMPSEELDEAPGAPAAETSRFAKLKKAVQDSEDRDELADLIDEIMSVRKL